MIRVLLADDEPMILAGVRAVLSTDSAVTVVAQARDGREAIALAQAHRPNVALLDIRMPALDGISAAAEIGRTVPQTAACISRRSAKNSTSRGRSPRASKGSC